MSWTKEYRAFIDQRGKAKTRGIDWHFTYDEWIAWWGDDIALRGKGLGKLHMCRYNDTGPYHPNNVYKGEHGHNSVKFNHNGVIAEGQTFPSWGQASRALNIHEDTLRWRYKHKWEGYDVVLGK